MHYLLFLIFLKGVFMFASTEILPEVKELDSFEFHTF